MIYAEITIGRASAVTALRLAIARDSIEEALRDLEMFKLGGKYFGDLQDLRIERIGQKPLRRVDYLVLDPSLVTSHQS